jgi:hypothetical protein
MMKAYKPRRKTMRRIATIGFILVAAPSFAETIYKYVSEDGSVMYSSDPIPGAKAEKRLELDPTTNVFERPAVRERDDERLSELRAQQEDEDAAREEVLRARAALDAAEASLAAGQEPLPGERRGTCVPRRNAAAAGGAIACATLPGIGEPSGAGGIPGAQANGVVLSREEGYDERIARLQAEVEKARLRLEQAIAKEKGYQ